MKVLGGSTFYIIRIHYFLKVLTCQELMGTSKNENGNYNEIVRTECVSY